MPTWIRPRVDVLETGCGDPAGLCAARDRIDTVVSALDGIRRVIVEAQRVLIDTAARAGVQRFVPRDYSTDYRRIAFGSNRNVELRREFAAYVDAAPDPGNLGERRVHRDPDWASLLISFDIHRLQS